MSTADLDFDTTEVDREIAKLEQRMDALGAKIMKPDRTADSTIIHAQIVVGEELRRLQQKRGDILGGKQAADVPPVAIAPTPTPAVLREPFRITPKDEVRKKVDTGAPSSEENQRELQAIFDKHADADPLAVIEDEFQGHFEHCKEVDANRGALYSEGIYIATLMVLARMNIEMHAIAEFQRDRRRAIEARLDAFESQVPSLQTREAAPSALEERIAALEARPTVKYLGVWKEGKAYVGGSMVTDKGSVWHADRATMQRPGASDDWVLAVKRGADGKDGKRV